MVSANQSLFSMRSSAGEAFRALHGQALWGQRWGVLTGRQHKLLSLTEVAQNSRAQTRRHAGLQLVPIAKICGSEGRCDDFDADFRPLKGHNCERWISVAVARRQDVALPPVELVQVDDNYFVRDGHHRISVAKLEGQLEIEAEVTLWHGMGRTESVKEIAQSIHQPRQPRYTDRLLMAVGKWFVNVGVQLQARCGVDASATALQGG